MYKYLFVFFVIIAFAACSQTSKTSDGSSTIEAAYSAQEFAEKIKNTPDAQIVDVRTPGEFRGGHIAGASNVSVSADDFKRMADALDKSKPVFVYCLSGGRSASAAQYFRSQGFKEIYQMPGGMMEWRNKNFPEEKLVVTSEGISVKEFEAMLLSNKTILVDFNAPWCAPCKKMKPFLEKIAEDMAETVTIIPIDADQNPVLVKAMNVSALPVLKIYKDQKEVWTHTGFMDEAGLREKLN